jgi:hypothetical protein
MVYKIDKHELIKKNNFSDCFLQDLQELTKVSLNITTIRHCSGYRCVMIALLNAMLKLYVEN